MTQPLAREQLIDIFREIDKVPNGKLSELAKIANLDLKRDYIGANLHQADLQGDNLKGVNLSRANLSQANLQRVDLSNGILIRVNLQEADLRGANLAMINLRKADLRGAILSRANLSEANLRGADLRGADLHGANIKDAHFNNAIMDDRPLIDEIPQDERTLLSIFYGDLLQKYRKEKEWTQQKLVEELEKISKLKPPINLEKLILIEDGLITPSKQYRQALDEVLSAQGVLSYYPSFSEENYDQCMEVRFREEKEAARAFLTKAEAKDFDYIRELYTKYQEAGEQNNQKIMLRWDGDLHRYMINNFYPNLEKVQVPKDYLEDNLNFYNCWTLSRDLDLDRELKNIHDELFEAFLEKDELRIEATLDRHLEHMKVNLRRVLNLLIFVKEDRTKQSLEEIKEKLKGKSVIFKAFQSKDNQRIAEVIKQHPDLKNIKPQDVLDIQAA